MGRGGIGVLVRRGVELFRCGVVEGVCYACKM